MTISIPPELEMRLKDAASRQGLATDEYAARLLEQGLVSSSEGDPTLELFAQWEREDHTDDPAEIARRNQEFEQFKEGMNQNRLESEGPNARKVYP